MSLLKCTEKGLERVERKPKQVWVVLTHVSMQSPLDGNLELNQDVLLEVEAGLWVVPLLRVARTK